MKDYFKRLFAYDLHANLLLLQQIQQAQFPPQAVRWIAHVAGAQKVWLYRCTHQSITQAIWPDWDLATTQQELQNTAPAWQHFLDSLDDAVFESTIIEYQNSQGASFQNRLSDILAHIINHGTHHRAQIGQAVKNNGISQLPITDYIFYLRDHL